MFNITTSRDLLAKLEADFEELCRSPGSARLALNCVITAYHLHEWVWGDWLKADVATRSAIGIDKDIQSFLAYIDRTCVWFPTIHALTNGTKHFSHDLSFKTMHVGMLPFAFDMPNAGWDESHWDGPAPYITGGTEYLLIDYGLDAGEHRWQLATQLIEIVVRFWREFFERFAPPIQLDLSSSVSAAK